MAHVRKLLLTVRRAWSIQIQILIYITQDKLSSIFVHQRKRCGSPRVSFHFATGIRCRSTTYCNGRGFQTRRKPAQNFSLRDRFINLLAFRCRGCYRCNRSTANRSRHARVEKKDCKQRSSGLWKRVINYPDAFDSSRLLRK